MRDLVAKYLTVLAMPFGLGLGIGLRHRRATNADSGGGGPAAGAADFSSPNNSGLIVALMEDI